MTLRILKYLIIRKIGYQKLDFFGFLLPNSEFPLINSYNDYLDSFFHSKPIINAFSLLRYIYTLK